jgi:hypothetical protein
VQLLKWMRKNTVMWLWFWSWTWQVNNFNEWEKLRENLNLWKIVLESQRNLSKNSQVKYMEKSKEKVK